MTAAVASGGKRQHQAVSVRTSAHVKMILHAARNPNSQVHGILLGSIQPSTSGCGPLLTVSDALPVCHEAPTKPILDMALRLADSYCVSKEEERIVGWYTANERMGDDQQPGQSAQRIAASIGARLLGGAGNDVPAPSPALPAHSEPVLILVTNQGIAKILSDDDGGGEKALRVFGRDDRKNWLRPIPEDNLDLPLSVEVAQDVLLQDKMKLPMFDFVDHMEGGLDKIRENDWVLNPAVGDFVRALE